MKKIILLLVFQIFISCSNEGHDPEAEIMGEWNLTREIVVEDVSGAASIEKKEIVYKEESIVYDFRTNNQLLIKEDGKPDLLMRYSCYDDINTEKEKIQEYIDINANTFTLSHSDGKLILDATQTNGPILYFERN